MLLRPRTHGPRGLKVSQDYRSQGQDRLRASRGGLLTPRYLDLVLTLEEEGPGVVGQEEARGVTGVFARFGVRPSA